MIDSPATARALAPFSRRFDATALERIATALEGRTPADVFYTRHPDDRRAETASIQFWDQPTVEHARAYLAAVLSTIRRVRSWGHDRRERTRGMTPPDVTQIGPYKPLNVLGFGCDGLVVRVEHTGTGQQLALKINARGDMLLPQAVGTEWPPFILRVVDGGWSDAVTHVRNDPAGHDVDIGATWGWIARELADGTLADFLEHHGGRLPVVDALEVFSVCAGAMAWLHDHGIYGWSAHTGNVFLVGDQWKIGDFGRIRVYLPSEHPLLVAERDDVFDDLSDDQDLGWLADWLLDRWAANWTAYGWLRQNVEAERRQRLNDCAGLAGLLVEMLTGNKWDAVFRAFNKQPFCSARYELTGDRSTDRVLSDIVNRAWRGDSWGAPVTANDGRGDQSVYDDARELLADATAVFDSQVALRAA